MRRLLAFVVALGLGGPAAACSAESDCAVGDRSYRVAVPEAAAGMPAVLFVHGYRGRAERVMRNQNLRALAAEMGAALIAVQSDGPGWNIPNNPRNPNTDGTAELAYFDAVRADVVARFGVDPARIVATGFSAGGMMIWNLACARPADYAGFVPVAGTFWVAPPETCDAPAANILHIHGDADTVVPLGGRPIGAVKQGDVSEALAMYGAFGGFEPAGRRRVAGLDCAKSRNPAGQFMDFCLFSGGHSFRTEHLRHALEKLRSEGW